MWGCQDQSTRSTYPSSLRGQLVACDWSMRVQQSSRVTVVVVPLIFALIVWPGWIGGATPLALTSLMVGTGSTKEVGELSVSSCGVALVACSMAQRRAAVREGKPWSLSVLRLSMSSCVSLKDVSLVAVMGSFGCGARGQVTYPVSLSGHCWPWASGSPFDIVRRTSAQHVLRDTWRSTPRSLIVMKMSGARVVGAGLLSSATSGFDWNGSTARASAYRIASVRVLSPCRSRRRSHRSKSSASSRIVMNCLVIARVCTQLSTEGKELCTHRITRV